MQAAPDQESIQHPAGIDALALTQERLDNRLNIWVRVKTLSVKTL